MTSRRDFLQMAASAAALASAPGTARAQTYPARPVRVIVPYPPGGDTDFLARLLGQRLSDRLGQPFVIENRPGAGTTIGTEAAARAAADGYTLLLSSPPSAINATLYQSLKYDFLRDFAPIAFAIRAPFVMVANPSVAARTVPEFIADSKANPGKMTMASAGHGSGPHLAGELFRMMTGVQMVHVPYRGQGPALTDVLGGQVQVYFGGLPTTIEHVRAGKLRALAVTTPSRSQVLPDIPPLGDFLPGYDASFWGGLCAPRNTPAEVIDRLNREINAALADAKLQARLAEVGGTPVGGAPGDFGKHIATETEKWAKVVKVMGIKPE